MASSTVLVDFNISTPQLGMHEEAIAETCFWIPGFEEAQTSSPGWICRSTDSVTLSCGVSVKSKILSDLDSLSKIAMPLDTGFDPDASVTTIAATTLAALILGKHEYIGNWEIISMTNSIMY